MMTLHRIQDLLAALISVYPPDRDCTVRSGSLPGEPTKGVITSTAQERQVVRSANGSHMKNRQAGVHYPTTAAHEGRSAKESCSV